jgi:transketolase
MCSGTRQSGPRSSSSTATSATGPPNARTRARRTASRWAKTRRAAKRFYGWPEDAEFLVPEGVREHFAEGIGKRGRDLRMAWEAKLGEYRSGYPELADQIERMQTRRLPNGWDQDIPAFPDDAKGLSGRDASGQVLNAIARHVPRLIGGAADLAPSTKTRLTFEGAGDFSQTSGAGATYISASASTRWAQS